MDTIGFIGLGTMGEPMALNLQKAGIPLLLWNRTPGRAEALLRGGAEFATESAEVFHRCPVVLTMLVDGAALDQVLGRSTPRFEERVKDRLVVSLATHSPAYARGLAADICAVGGRYAEAPVSGSRVPAEEGKLVAMVHPEDADALLEKMRRHRYGKDAAIIGEVRSDHPGRVVMKTTLGASRIVDMLVGDPLPRIC